MIHPGAARARPGVGPRRPTGRGCPRGALGLAAALLLLGPGCQDVRNFEGTWAGGVVAQAEVRQGFTAEARVTALALSNLDLTRTSATLTTSDGKFNQTPLVRVTRFSADLLASMTFDTDPLRTFLHFAPLANEPAGERAMALISLFGDDHVELRVIRGNDLFGVFHLRRRE